MAKMGKKMSPTEAKAKLATLKELMMDMDDMMMEDMKNKKGMSKVSVMADSPENLKKGLEKAEEVIEGEESSDMVLPKFGSKQESGAMMEEEEYEDDSEEDEESEDESEDDLDKKIAELLAKKKAKSKKQI